MNLDELGIKCHCDKSSLRHNYLVEYEKLFAPIKEKVKSVLELGVWLGGSLIIWEEYFKNAKIYGIDIKEARKVFSGKRRKVFIGEQQDLNFLDDVCKQTGELDIIINDCSHLVKDQIVSFEFLYYKLKRGGLYFIEDVTEPNLQILIHSIERIGADLVTIYTGSFAGCKLIVLKRPE